MLRHLTGILPGAHQGIHDAQPENKESLSYLTYPGRHVGWQEHQGAVEALDDRQKFEFVYYNLCTRTNNP